jgi:hypothetical protein
VLALTGALLMGAAHAGNTSLTEAGVKSLGSGLARVADCEMDKHIPYGTVGRVMNSLREGLTAEAWQRVKTQYQRSLHERTQYQISKDRWLAFEVTADNCRSLEKALPMLEASVAQRRE